MATIFQKLAASGDNCLILETKEALVYPIDLGQWDEMRMSFALSLTSSTDDNGTPANESLSDSYYIGLCSGISPFNFVGMGGQRGIRLLEGGAITRFACLDSGTAAVYNISTSLIRDDNIVYGPRGTSLSFDDKRIPVVSASAAQSVSTGIYARIGSMKYNVINRGQPGQYISFGMDSFGSIANDANVSIPALRTKNANWNSTQFTGFYWNSDSSETGSPLALPNSVYMKFPTINNRVRIHSLLVEKYA